MPVDEDFFQFVFSSPEPLHPRGLFISEELIKKPFELIITPLELIKNPVELIKKTLELIKKTRLIKKTELIKSPFGD